MEFKNGARAVLAVSPCGSGKTTLGVDILNSAQQKGNRCAVVGHKDIILGQWEQLTDADIWSIQKLYNRYTSISKYDLLLSDEAHLNAAPTHEAVLNSEIARHIIGFTATPCRFDGIGLDTVYDAIVLGPTPKQLISDGYLVPPIEYIIDEPDLSGLDIDAQRGQVAERMRKTHVTGDVWENYIKYAKGKRFALFPVTVEYGVELLEEAKRYGIRAEMITSDTPTDERLDIIVRLERGELDGIGSYDCISEGMNVPGIECILDCNPTGSLSKYIQRNSRGGRPAPDKTHYIILDFSGNFYRHGHVYDDHEWSLQGKKITKQEMDEKALSFSRCLMCLRPYKITLDSCPYCQADKNKRERKIKTKRGKLKLVTENEYIEMIVREEAKIKKKQDFKQARWAAKTYQECIDVYQRFGYNTYGARHYWVNRKRRYR